MPLQSFVPMQTSLQQLGFLPLTLLIWGDPATARNLDNELVFGPSDVFLEIAEPAAQLDSQLFKLSRPIKQISIGSAQKERADQLFQQGIEQYRVSQLREALQSLQAALEIYREIEDPYGEANSLNYLGATYYVLGEYQKAIELYEQSLTVVYKIGDPQQEANVLNNLGLVYLSLGAYEQAIELYEQSLVIKREIADIPGEINSLNNLGNAYGSLGQYQQAIIFLERSLEIAQEIGDLEKEAHALGNLGNAYDRLGQYQRAIELHEQSLAIDREIGDRRGQATSLGNLGLAYEGLGQYQRAIEFYEQSLVIYREIGDREGEVVFLGNLGHTYDNLGQYQQAIALLKQSLAIAHDIGYRDGEANASGLLGIVYNNLGQYQQAIEFHEQSLTIDREIGDPLGQATTLNNLAVVYFELDQYQQSINLLEEARLITREIGNRPLEGATLGNLGNAYNELGQYQKAIELHEQYLEIAIETSDRQAEANALGNLGTNYLDLNQFQQSINFHRQFLAIAHEIGDRQGEAGALNNIGLAELYLGLILEAEVSFLGAINILEELRDPELADADKVSLFEIQANTYKSLEQTYILQNQPEAALETAERGRSRAFVDLLTERLSRQQAEALSSAPPDLETIQRIARDQQSVLVEYSLIDIGPESPSLYIWVVQPSGQIDFQQVNLEDKDIDLTSLVIRSRNDIGTRNRGGFIPVEPSDEAGRLRQLHQILIDPIADLLPTDPEQRVVFIPQGPLFLVPFPALLDAKDTHLIEKHTILTAPSIQVLDLSQQQQRLRDAPNSVDGQDVLLVGNPDMPEVWHSDVADMRRLTDLPGAEAEANAIAEFFNTHALLHKDATEATVKQLINDARIVHLATHGLLEYGQPEDSGVRDLPGAIALAPGNGEDGLLTSAEILEELDLNAELVVLSACDTGLGDITGDGVIGLSRSLIAVGAPNVIVSLWSVPDAPTAELMTEFYRQIQREQDNAQALRQAMLKTMATHPDPVDWAAFTLIGAAQ